MSMTLPPPRAVGPDDRGPSGPGRTAAPADHDDRHPPRRWPGRRSLAVLMTITAFLGGAASTGVLALSGALGDDAHATTMSVVPASTSGTSDTSSTNVDAKAIYASASAGVVDITATGTGALSPARSARAPRSRRQPARASSSTARATSSRPRTSSMAPRRSR